MEKSMVWLWVILACAWLSPNGFAETDKQSDSVVSVTPASLTAGQKTEDVFSKGLITPEEERESKRKAFFGELSVKAQEFRMELAAVVMTPDAQEKKMAEYRAQTASRIAEFLNSEKSAEKIK